MKKGITILVAVVAILVATVVSSCSHHTCPAYRGSMAEVVE